jgi:carboxyl-terminal processing protease
MKDYFGPNSSQKQKSIRSYGVILIIVVAFFIGWQVGNNKEGAPNAVGATNVENVGVIPESYPVEAPDFNTFWEVWQNIKDEFVNQPVNESDLYYGAMTGLVGSLGDPYSEFYDPRLAAQFNEELSGSFSGIGAEVAIKNNLLVIVAPLDGSPAQAAGVRAGDIVIGIDGEESFAMRLDQAVSLIRGKEGTTVTLTIVRGENEPQDIIVTRQTIEHTGIRWEILDGDIAHLRLSSFDEDAENLLNQFIREEVQTNKVKGIVLDMRNDPGGFLDMAIEVSSEWIEQGIVLRERDNSGEEQQHHARGRARLSAIPTVVLVNEGSASASEIVAGALQDYGIAQIVGETTFGKGSVQKYQTLEDGSSYRMTVAKWFTPLERAIDEVGIVPDIEIELTEEDFDADNDPQLEKALELLR